MVPTTGVAASVVIRYALGHDLVPVHPEPLRFGEGRGLSAQHVAEPGQLNLGAAHADEAPYLGRDLLSPLLTKIAPGKLEQAPDAVLPSEPELALAPQALRLVFGIDAGVRHLEDRIIGINHGSYFAGSPARLLPILRTQSIDQANPVSLPLSGSTPTAAWPAATASVRHSPPVANSINATSVSRTHRKPCSW